MSNAWYRFGGLPFGSPLPIDTIFYLTFIDEIGQEEVTHSYNKSAQTFSPIKADRVTVSQAATLTTFSIDGQVVLSLDAGQLKAFRIFERPPPNLPAIMFRSRNSVRADLLALVNKDGEFFAHHFEEMAEIPDVVDSIRLRTSGALKTAISIAGVQMVDLHEREDVLTVDGTVPFEFATGVDWLI